MHLGFYFFILFSALGKAPRNIGTITALVGLLGYYALDYKNSNLKLLGNLKWIYFIFLSYLFFKAFHNIQVSNGWYGFRTNIHQSFALFFIGLEVVKRPKDLVRLVILFCVAGFYQGLDGVYQWFTGVNFFRSYPIAGSRLTGPMPTPRVGNYISMLLPIMVGTWWILPKQRFKIIQISFLSLLLFPPLFLLIGSQTRSGILGTFVALWALFFIHKGFSLKKFLITLGIIVGTLFWGSKRFTLETLMSDPRLKELWPHAIQVFKSAPLLGVGLNSYNPGVHNIGLKFVIEKYFIQHPHNIYLQFLCEMGIIGLILLLVFYGSYLLWAIKKIWRGLKNKQQAANWSLTACFWMSFLGYMVTAISGHDFFRTWWLGLALSILGIIMGSCLVLENNAKNDE